MKRSTCLNGVTVTGLAKDLQQCRVRDKEESRKHQSFAFQISANTFTLNVYLLNNYETRRRRHDTEENLPLCNLLGNAENAGLEMEEHGYYAENVVPHCVIVCHVTY